MKTLKNFEILSCGNSLKILKSYEIFEFWNFLKIFWNFWNFDFFFGILNLKMFTFFASLLWLIGGQAPIRKKQTSLSFNKNL
jgi:hypothetical protein